MIPIFSDYFSLYHRLPPVEAFAFLREVHIKFWALIFISAVLILWPLCYAAFKASRKIKNKKSTSFLLSFTIQFVVLGLVFLITYPKKSPLFNYALDPNPTFGDSTDIFFIQPKENNRYFCYFDPGEKAARVLFLIPPSVDQVPFLKINNKTRNYDLWFSQDAEDSFEAPVLPNFSKDEPREENPTKTFSVRSALINWEAQFVQPLTKDRFICQLGNMIVLIDEKRKRISPLVWGMQPTVSTVNAYQPPSFEKLVNVKSANQIPIIRKELIRYIWKKNTLPYNQKPHKVERDHKANDFKDLTGVARIDRLVVNMKNGVTSAGYYLIPSKDSKNLLIFHGAHHENLEAAKGLIHYFLNRGIHVLALSMPLTGDENQRLSKGNPMNLHSHDDLKKLTSFSFSPLTYFLDPVALSLNYVLENGSFETISMAGGSGGGWTTVLYSALDTRVQHSISVAGSLPRALRFDFERGDYEQWDPSLYQIASYMDLYILGAVGKGRSQFHILNRYDSCCFSGDRFLEYGVQLKQHVQQLGRGHYGFVIDNKQVGHNFSSIALKMVRDTYVSPTID